MSNFPKIKLEGSKISIFPLLHELEPSTLRRPYGESSIGRAIVLCAISLGRITLSFVLLYLWVLQVMSLWHSFVIHVSRASGPVLHQDPFVVSILHRWHRSLAQPSSHIHYGGVVACVCNGSTQLFSCHPPLWQSSATGFVLLRHCSLQVAGILRFG